MIFNNSGPPAIDALRDLESYLRRCRTSSDYYIGYLYWLMDIVDAPSNYSVLFLELLDIPFVWNDCTKELSMDSNRSADGLRLRDEFIKSYIVVNEDSVTLFEKLIGPSCSVLEMIVALCQRMARHVSEREIDVIFWDIMDNLGLNEYNNDRFNEDKNFINDLYYIIERMETRKYGKTGKGSMFPIAKRGYDLSKMEIWRQANLYCTCKE